MIEVTPAEYVPNNFNFDFLDTTKKKLPSFTPPTTLRLLESSDPINETVVKNKRIVYSLAGSELTRLTNESNLHEKISTYNESLKKQAIEINSNSEENKETNDKEKSGDEEKEKAKEDKRIRYFTVFDETTDSMKCRRCGEYGHYLRNCTTTVKESCFYCMGKHHFLDCLQSTCHRCNGIGHKAKECLTSHAKCYRCEKYGHREVNCNTILFGDYKSGGEGVRDMKRVRCLNCQKTGHANCAALNKKDKLYEDYSDKNQEVVESKSKRKSHHRQRNYYGEDEQEQDYEGLVIQSESRHRKDYRNNDFVRYDRKDHHNQRDRNRENNYRFKDSRSRVEYEERNFNQNRNRGTHNRDRQVEDYKTHYNQSHKSISKIQRQFEAYEKERSREHKMDRREERKGVQRKAEQFTYREGNKSNSKKKFSGGESLSKAGKKKNPIVILE